MKPLLALTAITLSIGTSACGSGEGTHSTRGVVSGVATPGRAPAGIGSGTVPARRYLNDSDNDPSNDKDFDDRPGNVIDEDSDSEDNANPENSSYHDKDDNRLVAVGHEANTVDRRAITALVKRYYAVAVAHDSAKVCSIIVSSLARTIPQDYGQAPGPSYLRGGKTCQAIVSLLFKHAHAQLIRARAMKVTGVRINGDNALALLGSTSMPPRTISAEREGGVWKINQLLGGTLP